MIAGDDRVEKRLDADPEAERVAPDRRGGWAALLSLGDEAPPDGDRIRAISVQHGEREQAWFGLAVPWWLCWLGASTALALVLRRRFDVAL